jgi:hypothetical protein
MSDDNGVPSDARDEDDASNKIRRLRIIDSSRLAWHPRCGRPRSEALAVEPEQEITAFSVTLSWDNP